MKEKILNVFKELGFELEELDDTGYGFHYEGKNFIYLCSEDDENFLNIVMPGVLEIDDEDDIMVYKIMDKLNATLKFVKAYKFQDNVWLAYEHEVNGDDNLHDLLSRMILHLDVGASFLYRLITNADKQEEYDDTDDDFIMDDDELENNE